MTLTVDVKLDDIMDELDGVDSTLQVVKGKLDKVFALTKNTRFGFGSICYGLTGLYVIFILCKQRLHTL